MNERTLCFNSATSNTVQDPRVLHLLLRTVLNDVHRQHFFTPVTDCALRKM
jgi:hypothetical protein